ncbi:MAG: hypothetical protein IBJ03_16695 [Gemmatimonadaceae bacterium]|nr:hypothetical protein [Gemmatimonadaceae bacterium]
MDPLGLLPYALAAGGGRLDGHDVPRLVAAGVTLLQRSAPLVRAMAGRHAAIRPSSWSEWLMALAASDGRGLLMLPGESEMSVDSALATLASHQVGALFSDNVDSATWANGSPVNTLVALGTAPARALVRSDTREQAVDLGTHFGLDLIGDTATPGRDEPCLALGNESWRTHREVIGAARSCMERHGFTPVHRTLNWLPFADWAGLVSGTLAPLLAGGMVLGRPSLSASDVHAHLMQDDASVLVLSADQLTTLAAKLREHPLGHDPLVRVLVSSSVSEELAAAWRVVSSSPLEAIAL